MVANFWLPAVELTIFDMCYDLSVLPVVVSRDIERAGGSPFESLYRRAQKHFSIALAALD
jgi:hypothetical protein